MPSVKISGSLKGVKGMEIVGDWLTESFNDMTTTLPTVLKKSLDTAAFIIKDSVKQEFTTAMPAAARPFKVPATSNNGYKLTKPDKLVDAVRQSSSDGQRATVFMGGREKGSPLFIAKMYNENSQDRYVKTKNGVKLEKPKFVGHLTGVHYWDPGVTAGEQEAYAAIERIVEKNLEKILD